MYLLRKYMEEKILEKFKQTSYAFDNFFIHLLS